MEHNGCRFHTARLSAAVKRLRKKALFGRMGGPPKPWT